MNFLTLLLTAFVVAPAAAQVAVCPTGTDAGSITIGGSSTVAELTPLWIDGFKAQCKSAKITRVNKLGSGIGARQVCGDKAAGGQIDIGSMSSEWFPGFAYLVTLGADGYTYKCTGAATTGVAGSGTVAGQLVKRLDIALDGVTVAVATSGLIDNCITKIGGLSVDQLRWIFSSFTESQLKSAGVNIATAIPNSDGNDGTHKWSEINSGCPASEIRIVGPGNDSGTHSFFKSTILTGKGEDFAYNRNYVGYSDPSSTISDIVRNAGTAVGFFGFAYFNENRASLTAIPIKATSGIQAGKYVTPSASSIAANLYIPLSRRLYNNLRATQLFKIKYWVEYWYSPKGIANVRTSGYVPIPIEEYIIQLSRAGAKGGIDFSKISCGSPASTGFKAAGSATVYPITNAMAIAFRIKCGSSNSFISNIQSDSGPGLSRLCVATSTYGGLVDIGPSSRKPKSTEATAGSPAWKYTCVPGAKRVFVQNDVAIDGVSFAVVKGGAFDQCINSIGGLTIDQLRWIFSSFTVSQLQASSWSASSLPGNDGNDNTHLLSELGKTGACTSTPIKVFGPTSVSGTYSFVAGILFKGAGETYATNRATNPYIGFLEPDTTAGEIGKSGYAMGYFGYSYYAANSNALNAAKVKNAKGQFVAPSASTILSNTYNPFTRRIYFNTWNGSFSRTRPFVQLAYTDVGSAIVTATGYVPIPANERAGQSARVN